MSRLTASLARDGQRSPVLVVAGAVLVDGYHRVAALRQLGRDVLSAVELPVAEADALVLAWRLETGRRKSALEEAWMLQELTGTHGRRASELALELRRPRSWVSQRPGLVRVLPETVQVTHPPMTWRWAAGLYRDQVPGSQRRPRMPPGPA